MSSFLIFDLKLIGYFTSNNHCPCDLGHALSYVLCCRSLGFCHHWRDFLVPVIEVRNYGFPVGVFVQISVIDFAMHHPDASFGDWLHCHAWLRSLGHSLDVGFRSRLRPG